MCSLLFMKAMAHEQSKTSAHKCLQRLKVDFEAVFVSILLPLSLSARLLRKHSSFKSSTQQPSGNRCTQKPTIKKKNVRLKKPFAESRKAENSRKLKEVELILQSDVQEAKRLAFFRKGGFSSSRLRHRLAKTCKKRLLAASMTQSQWFFMSDGFYLVSIRKCKTLKLTVYTFSRI